MTGRRRGPQRTLADWTREDGDQAEWLASWEAGGWRPEYSWGGTAVVLTKSGRAVLRRILSMLSVSPCQRSHRDTAPR